MFFEFDSDPNDPPKDESLTPNDKPGGSFVERPPKCSTPLSTTLRNRRYSIHSDVPSRSVGFRPHPTSGSNCDLALLAKKKLDEVDDACATLNDLYEPDIKISKATKHSSSDLRREVLLHSMQRSLSMSSEDLSSFATPSSINSLGPRCQSSLSRRSFPSSSRSGCDMEVLCEDFSGDPLQGSSYKPSENQVQNNSRMIYTATNSLAGSRFSENRLNYLAKRQNALNLSSSSPSSSSTADNGEAGKDSSDPSDRSYMDYSQLPSACPVFGSDILTPTLTIWSPSPLKKRCHSSPTKYHANTPYSFGGHQNCLASVVTPSRDHNGPLFSTGTFSPPPDPTNKKFKGSPNAPLPKVNLFDSDIPSSSSSSSSTSNVISNTDQESSANSANMSTSGESQVTVSVSTPDQADSSTVAQNSAIQSPNISQNPARNDRELGQLTQDFDRLKTPFQ